MTETKGTLIEKRVEKIFSSAGFKTKRNVKYEINDETYEIDILAKTGGIKIAIDCEEYKRSKTDISDRIFKWSAKKKKIGVDRIFIVAYGQKVSKGMKNFAKGWGIIIWDTDDFDNYYKLSSKHPEAVYSNIIHESNIDVQSIINPTLEKIKALAYFIVIVIFLIGLIGQSTVLVSVCLTIIGYQILEYLIYKSYKEKKNMKH